MSAARSQKVTGRKPTLSPTRISTFLDCAVKYRNIYVDKIGRYYLRARAGYSFGSTLHHVLQQYHEQGERHTAEEMMAEIDQRWISSGYDDAKQEQEHREEGRRIVEAYREAQQQRTILAVETIATEKTITCDMGRFKLTGRVDRIDRHADGRLEVIDYKSGRAEITPEDVAGNLAMSCYQLILSKSYPDTPIRATIYCLRSGAQVSSDLQGVEMKAFEQDILELGAQILDTDYAVARPRPVPACSDCDFLPRCEQYWRHTALEDPWELDESEHSDHGL